MLAGACMAKTKKPDPSPEGDGGRDLAKFDRITKEEIKELMGEDGLPVKLPLWFKQKLERIQIKINHGRKQKDPKAKDIPAGYFIVAQMKDWVDDTLLEMEGEALAE